MTFTELGSGNSRGLSCAFIWSTPEMSLTWILGNAGTLNPKAFGVIRYDASGLPGTPAFVISLAYVAGIGNRRYLHPNVELFVAFNRGFPGAAALFAPHQG